MEAAGYFTLAVLILVLLPPVVLPWEGQRPPDAVYLVIAACGLASSAWHGGWAGLAWSAAGALGCVLLIGAAVTKLRASSRLRIFTGGQIKLMAAGAAWLGPGGTLAMVVFTIILLFSWAAVQQIAESQRRPDSAMVVAITIMTVALQQQIAGA